MFLTNTEVNKMYDMCNKVENLIYNFKIYKKQNKFKKLNEETQESLRNCWLISVNYLNTLVKIKMGK